MECGLLCNLTDICRLVPVFSVLDENEFSSIWAIVALCFLFVF